MGLIDICHLYFQVYVTVNSAQLTRYPPIFISLFTSFHSIFIWMHCSSHTERFSERGFRNLKFWKEAE